MKLPLHHNGIDQLWEHRRALARRVLRIRPTSAFHIFCRSFVYTYPIGYLANDSESTGPPAELPVWALTTACRR